MSTIDDYLTEISSSADSLEGYVSALIAAGLLVGPEYYLVTLAEICAAAPQYDPTTLSERALEMERDHRLRREQCARDAQSRVGISPFSTPARWIPRDD